MRTRLALLLLSTALLLSAAVTPSAQAGTLGNANFHHGFHVGSPNSLWDSLSGQLGADTIRIQVYWSEYETGPNQYSQGFLDGIVNRVQSARSNSGNSNIKALVNFDLPGEAVPWMQAAGYALADPSKTGAFPRYYPTSGTGLEAYGRAAAKALKYLYNAGVVEFLETPNEPNLTNGISDPIDAVKVGQMAGQAVSYAASEGLQLNGATGPAILVGSVATGQAGTAFYQYSPTQYFETVQWWTDFTIEQWWKNAPNGPSYAVTLMGTWRPSFHSYPDNGGNESAPCEIVKEGKRQDELGNLTGELAYGTVIARLEPLLEKITRSKKWWLTETGMSSYKTSNKSEGYEACIARRKNGGSVYGKEQQRYFYQAFVTSLNYLIKNGGYKFSGFEGATFFLPVDDGQGGKPLRQFAGYGVHAPANLGSCNLPYPCRKPAAETFSQYYGSSESLPPAGWAKDNIGGSASNCGGIGSEPAITSWGPGRLDLFICGSDSALWHRFWVEGIGWGAWESLGGVLTSPPSAVSWGPNRIDVVARGSYNHVWHWAWNGSTWSAEDIYGEVSSAPAVTSREVGNLEVFARGADGALWQKYLNSGVGWGSWASLGGSLTSGPSTVAWGPGRVDVANASTNGSVVHWFWGK